MKRMSLKREISIQRLQTKNRMVGQTFNPSGITSEQIKEREQRFLEEMKAKPLEERKEYWNNVQEILQARKKHGIRCSREWQWCVFERNKSFLLS